MPEQAPASASPLKTAIEEALELAAEQGDEEVLQMLASIRAKVPTPGAGESGQ